MDCKLDDSCFVSTLGYLFTIQKEGTHDPSPFDHKENFFILETELR